MFRYFQRLLRLPQLPKLLVSATVDVWDIFKGYLGYHSYQNYWCPQKLWCSGIFKGYQCYHSYQHWPKFVTTKKYSSPLPTITQNEQALRQLRASSINGEKLQCAIYFIPESMISEVTLVTNITRYSHIFFKTSICGTYRAPTGYLLVLRRVLRLARMLWGTYHHQNGDLTKLLKLVRK